jgi:RimJ/RimL family protein N-acetyltransferase
MSEDAENLEENPIEFKCPYCGKLVSFPDREAGGPRDCPYCTEIFVIPQASAEFGLQLPMPIKTSRLVLEPLQSGDQDEMLRLMENEELLREWGLLPLDYPAIADWLEKVRRWRFTTPGQSLWLGIHLLDHSRLIGLALLTYTPNYDGQLVDREAQINVLIDRSFQSTGYGTETVHGLLEFGFRGIHLRRIIAGCRLQNLAGQRCLEKAGLRQEGEFLQDREVNGQWVDTAWYAMLAEEFQSP